MTRPVEARTVRFGSYIAIHIKLPRNQNWTYRRYNESSNRNKWLSPWIGIAIFILSAISFVLYNFALKISNHGHGHNAAGDECASVTNFSTLLTSSPSFHSFMMISLNWYTALAVLPFLAAAAADSFEQDCAGFATKSNFSNTNVYFSQYLAAGSSLSIAGGLSGSTPNVPADVCRIAAYTATSNRSGINFETWLPRKWTGRFMSHGNGGLAGNIDYSNLAYTSSNGFAAVSANSVSTPAFWSNIEAYDFRVTMDLVVR
jgi:hypothetical protein